MKREHAVAHLNDQGCYLDEKMPKNTVGEWFRNCVNHDICLIPIDEELSATTVVHCCYEMRVAPPFDLESDYEVYSLWRKKILEQSVFSNPFHNNN